jgi:hypothetical protein
MARESPLSPDEIDDLVKLYEDGDLGELPAADSWYTAKEIVGTITEQRDRIAELKAALAKTMKMQSLSNAKRVAQEALLKRALPEVRRSLRYMEDRHPHVAGGVERLARQIEDSLPADGPSDSVESEV